MKREKIDKGTPDVLDLPLAAALFWRGETMETIGMVLGVPAKKAASALRKAGYPVPYGKRKPAHLAGKRGPMRRLSIEEEGMLVRMRDVEGMSFTTIGLAFDVSRQRAHALYQRAKGIVPVSRSDDDE